MAWDPVSQRVLMFGGTTDAGGLSDTWTWDGTDWMQLQPSTTPRSSFGLLAATDPVRRRIVLYESVDRLSEWDGVDWTPVATPTAIPRGRREAFAFDGVNNAMLIAFRDEGPDSWLYDGAGWPWANPKPARVSNQLATDVARSRVTMRTGSLDGTPRNWEWNGERWHATQSANEPPIELTGSAMTHDHLRQRTLLFGGERDGVFQNDLWEWDGVDWALRTPATLPTPRNRPVMTFDAARGFVLMVGGQVGPNVPLRETWTWDGTDWTMQNPATVPVVWTDQLLAFDARRGRVVMLAWGAGLTVSTWEWDGNDWTAAAAASSRRWDSPSSGCRFQRSRG